MLAIQVCKFLFVRQLQVALCFRWLHFDELFSIASYILTNRKIQIDEPSDYILTNYFQVKIHFDELRSSVKNYLIIVDAELSRNVMI